MATNSSAETPRPARIVSSEVRSKHNMPMPSEPMCKANTKALLGEDPDAAIPAEDPSIKDPVRRREAAAVAREMVDDLVETGAQMEGHTRFLRKAAMTSGNPRLRRTLGGWLESQDRMVPPRAFRSHWPRKST